MASSPLPYDSTPHKQSPVSLANFVDTMDDCLDTVSNDPENTTQWRAVAEAFRLTLAALRTILDEEGDQSFVFTPGTNPRAKRIKQRSLEPIAPLIDQYLKDRDYFTNSVLCYRTGAFITFLYNDAIMVSSTFGLPLTTRNFGGAPSVPVCCVHEEIEDQIFDDLTKLGCQIVVCEQNDHRYSHYTFDTWSACRIITSQMDLQTGNPA
jgi:hypothetical protein